ncbi:MAG: 2'-5' RNA ligase [Chloroflexi bacterium RBG_19FT_COMBO_56_12]|nr:MAG: 2'-5' RNA ligase [Chloroflexi bacterium RBG_19FT_COMBO_56_12]
MSSSVIRAFIGVDLSPEIQHCLEQVSTQLKERLEGDPVRWIPAENIHLTLKFLGDVSQANLEMLKKILRAVVPSHPSFEISVGGLGAYPKVHHPRVIWIGLEVPSDLVAIQHSIETETARLGYAREERPFSPHLTLGRVSRNASPAEIHQLGEVLDTFKVGFLGAARVRAIHLYRSDLKPGGAVYTRLFSVPLEGIS